MSWIDVAIPGVGGLLLIAFPRMIWRTTGDDEQDARNAAHLRRIGGVLLIIASSYWAMRR